MVGAATGRADGMIKVGITTGGISGLPTTDGMTNGSLTVMAAMALTRSLWMHLAFAVEPVSCHSSHYAANAEPGRSQRVYATTNRLLQAEFAAKALDRSLLLTAY